MVKQRYPLSKVYGLLEPGPVLLVTTAGKTGPNVMTLSWHTMMDFEPPIVGFVMSDRNASFESLRKTRQCVLNIPTVGLAQEVVGVGNCSGRKVDKFARFGLTPVKAKAVAPPLIDECYANLECQVIDTRQANQYNFFILEVVKAWINPSITNPQTLHHRGRGSFMVAGETIKLPSKMK